MTDYRMWTSAPTLSTAFLDHPDKLTFGNEFYVTERCVVKALHFYKGSNSFTGTITGRIYRVDSATAGTTLSGTDGTFSLGATVGWKTITPATPVEIITNQRYRVCYYTPNGHYSETVAYWRAGGLGANGHTNGPLVMPNAADATGTMQSSYGGGPTAAMVFPTLEFDDTNWWIDVTVAPVIESSAIFDMAITKLVTPTLVANSSGEFNAVFAMQPEANLVVASSAEFDAAFTSVFSGSKVLTDNSAMFDAAISLNAESHQIGVVADITYGRLGFDQFEFFAMTDDGSVLIPLPDVESHTVSDVDNDAGTISITYPANGINFDTLKSNVTQDSDLEIAVYLNGVVRPELQAILNESGGSDIDEDAVWEFSGSLVAFRLTEAVVVPDGGMPKQGDDANDRDAHFYSATAGTIIRTLLLEAQTRGAVPDITYGTFSNTHDSNGRPWSKIITIKISPGMNYLEVLRSLVEVGLSEFRMYGYALKVYDIGYKSEDRTLADPPLVFRGGRDIVDSPRKHSARETATTLLVGGGDGLYHEETDATALATRGRRIEVYSSQGGITDAGSLDAYTELALQRHVHGKMEKSHGLSLTSGGPKPLRAFNVGDWGYSEDVDAGLEKLKIKQWTVSGDNTGKISGAVVLNDLFEEWETQLAQRIQGIEGGTTLAGSSQARPNDQVDTTIPKQPTGLLLSSLAYTGGDGRLLASVRADWDDVVQNSDNTAISDLQYYAVTWRYTRAALQIPGLASWAWFTAQDSVANWSSVKVNEEIEVRIAAVDDNGKVSTWSASAFHTTATDTTAPPVPSAPTVVNNLGSIKISWDGLGSAGEAMPEDFAHTEVHVSTTSGFTPLTSTLYAKFLGKDTTTYVGAYGVGIFVRLVSSDTLGNKSAASTQGSATPQQLVTDELINSIITAPKIVDFAVGSAKIENAAVIEAKIANLAVTNAKVNSIEVGKLTAGTLAADVVVGANIATALTGQRAGMNAQGLFAYDSNSALTFQVTNGGSVLVTGEVRTRNSGERLVWNPGGAAPSEVKFYSSDVNGTAATLFTSSWTNPLNTSMSVGSIWLRSAQLPESPNRYSYFQNDWLESAMFHYDTSTQKYWSRFRAYGEYARIETANSVWIDFKQVAGVQYNAYGFQLTWYNTAGSTLGGCEIDCRTSDGAGVYQSSSGAAGIYLIGNQVHCYYSTNPQSGGAHVAINATAFNVVSGVEEKEEIEDVTLDVLDLIERAPIKRWKYRHEQPYVPPAGIPGGLPPGLPTRKVHRPKLNVHDELGSSTEDYVEYDVPVQQRPPARPRIGPIAEDWEAVAPELVTRFGGRMGGKYIDMTTLASLAMEGVRRLCREQRQDMIVVHNRILALEAAVAGLQQGGTP